MTERVTSVGVRISAEDKEYFVKRTAEAHVEAGTAARQLVELVIKHMREHDADFIDALKKVKDALK